MPDILLLQHADWELPGTYGDVLAARHHHVRVVRPDRGEALPDWRDFDAVLAMGGPMSVNDEAELPWLAQEKALVAAAVTADLPYFGACLGAQLLASALGAEVYRGPRPEYGMHTVVLSPAGQADPVFTGLATRLDVFQWHGETFDLPPGGVRLAGSPGLPNQAFRVGRRAYGVQFHLEVSGALLATWLDVPGCRDEARRELGHDAEALLAKQMHAADADMAALARLTFGRWLDLIAS